MKKYWRPQKFNMGGQAPDGIYVEMPDYQVDTGFKNNDGSPKKLRLGHGMVIAVEENTGSTRGSEYGRYDPENKGLARRVRVPDFHMKDPGNPTQEELDNYASQLNQSYGHTGGRIKAHYVKGADYDKMVGLMQSAEQNQDDSYYHNRNYAIVDHNCGTYAADLIKKALPWYKIAGFSPYTIGTPSMVAPMFGMVGDSKK